MVKPETIIEIFEKAPWYYYGPLKKQDNELGVYAGKRFYFPHEIRDELKKEPVSVKFLVGSESFRISGREYQIIHGKFPPKRKPRLWKKSKPTRVHDIIRYKDDRQSPGYNTEAHFVAWNARDLGEHVGGDAAIVVILQEYQYETVEKFFKEGVEKAAKFIQTEIFDRRFLHERLLKDGIVESHRNRFATKGGIIFNDVEGWEWSKKEDRPVPVF
jgi:hypothetical protein